jgi:predicted kinase
MKYILVVNGPMLAGKSTLTKLFLQENNTLRISSDVVKWLIGGYDSSNQDHKKLKEQMSFSIAEIGVRNGYSLIVDGGHEKYRNAFKKLAKDNDYTFLSINLESPKDILEKRFFDRVASAKTTNSKKISVTSIDGFNSRYDWYINKNKDFDAQIIDSSKYAPEEILDKVKKLLALKKSN